MKPKKYFLYARKSSETEERQVKSIEDQILELTEYARYARIKISKRFIESKSAKYPGRPIFNDMIMQIHNSRQPVGLLAWHPDRLARNSVDGGQIIYLVDIQKVIALEFPTFWFEPTPQGLFMLQIAFGQSKYYSDNLSENIKRGNRQKVRRGEWLGNTPYGYKSNQQINNIEPNPTQARVVKKMFEDYATGKYSLASMCDRMFEHGVHSRNGRPFSKSSVQTVLSNPVYVGLIKYKGEVFEGKFEPIISQGLYDAVQEELHTRARPRRSKYGHNWPLTSLFNCGSCGCGITAQWSKGRRYSYYRCTKKKDKCSESYVATQSFVSQIKERLAQLKLSDEWCSQMRGKLKRKHWQMERERKLVMLDLEKKIEAAEMRIDKLIDAFLDENIERSLYLKKKQNMLTRKLNLEQRLKDLKNSSGDYLRPLEDVIHTCKQAIDLVDSDDLEEIKGFLRRTTTNRIVRNKTVHFDFLEPYDKIAKGKWEESEVFKLELGQKL